MTGAAPSPALPPTDESIGLIQSYVLDERGGASRVDRAGVERWSPESSPIWVHMDLTAAAAAAWLESAAELDTWIVEALTSPGSRPRTVVHDNGVLIVLRGPNLNPGAEPSVLIPLAIWADQHRLITLRSEALRSITDLRVAFEAGIGPANVADAVIFLVNALGVRLDDLVARFDGELDRLDELDQLADRGGRRALAALRQDIARLRRFLVPQREAVSTLARASPRGFDREDFIQLREQVDRYTRLVEELETAREEAAIVQQEWADRADELTNRRLYVLAIITAVFLPLTLVSGLFGMNVGGMPLLHSQAGFAVATGVITGLGVALMLFFKARHWL